MTSVRTTRPAVTASRPPDGSATPEWYDAELIARARAVLDRRDERQRLERKREYQRRYNQSEKGRAAATRYRESRHPVRGTHPVEPMTGWQHARLPEQVMAREHERQLLGHGVSGRLHATPVLDTSGLEEVRPLVMETHGGQTRKPPEWKRRIFTGTGWMEAP